MHPHNGILCFIYKDCMGDTYFYGWYIYLLSFNYLTSRSLKISIISNHPSLHPRTHAPIIYYLSIICHSSITYHLSIPFPLFLSFSFSVSPSVSFSPTLPHPLGLLSALVAWLPCPQYLSSNNLENMGDSVGCQRLAQ